MISAVRKATSLRRLAATAAAAALLGIAVSANAADEDKTAAPVCRTFYLHNVTDSHDANDLTNALRNMVPRASLYLTATAGAITVRGTDAEIATIQQVIADLDRPRKTWRLTYTVTEIDGGKSSDPQRFTLTVAEGAKTFLKQGTRVPIVTGKYETDKSTGPETQVQYVDVGLNVEATLEGFQDGLRLKTKFEQSALADAKPGISADDPVIQQTTMETTSALVPGKEVSLGSVAEPNSPHHVQVSVTAEAVK
jgi:type II secretory pathway component GspD/PulD (secretin)